MNEAHSPLPWRINRSNSTQIEPNESDTRKVAIARTGCSHGLGDAGERDIANAAHIVRCVNAHDALVEALAWLKEFSLLLDRVIAHNVEVPISQGYVYDHSSLRTMKTIVDKKLKALRQAEEACGG